MLRAYLSHPIRGAKGAVATQEDMEANNRKAIEFAWQLRARFPGLDLYVPAEHDEFVMHAYMAGYLTEQEILDVDCTILRKCDLLIVYMPDGHVSSGMSREIAEAALRGMYVGYTDGTSFDAIEYYLRTCMR